MSQKIINELTDTVSALKGCLDAHDRLFEAMANEAKLALVTAQGEMDRANRAEAERDALAERLRHMLWTHDDSMGDEEIEREFDEIMTEARNDLPEPFSMEERRLAEWLSAILNATNELMARGLLSDPNILTNYARAALKGERPHWMDADYLKRASDSRRR
jgi:hypothetical protein